MEKFDSVALRELLFELEAARSKEEKQAVYVNAYANLSPEEQTAVYRLIRDMIKKSDRE